ERQQPRQRVDHEGLGETWHTFEQVVPAGEDGDEEFLEHLALADDDLGKLRQHLLVRLAEAFELLFDFLVHGWFRGGISGGGSTNSQSESESAGLCCLFQVLFFLFSGASRERERPEL